MQPPYLSLLLLLLSGLSISSPVAKDSKQFPISSQLSPLSRVRTRMPTSSRWLCNQRVGQVAIYDFLADNAYATNVTIGTQDFLLLIDTGSSDTWVVETGFTCYNGSINNTVPEADCQFASTFTVDSTFYEIPDENFHLKYVSPSSLDDTLKSDRRPLFRTEMRDVLSFLYSSLFASLQFHGFDM